ncbi:hypothetical protein ThvES_00008210 [Thiovulum sp. ES]|nr:hypothetical protein ThvES_00008210 [Thiovulum sp. ES]
MARPGYNEIRNLGTFANQNRWMITFAKFPNVGDYPDSEDVNFRCTTSSVPKITEKAGIEVDIRGMHVGQPGTYDFDHELTLTLVETEDSVIHSLIKSWRDACYDYETGKQNKKEDIEAILILSRLDVQDNPIWQYKLLGVYLKDYDPGSMANEPDKIELSLTLWYDKFTDGKSV